MKTGYALLNFYFLTKLLIRSGSLYIYKNPKVFLIFLATIKNRTDHGAKMMNC